MSEVSKYDLFLKDLDALEAQVSILKNKYKAALEKNKELEVILTNAKNEKARLTEKIEALQGGLKKIQNDSDGFLVNSLNIKEREKLKIKLQDLISKIDYHLSVEKAGLQ